MKNAARFLTDKYRKQNKAPTIAEWENKNHDYAVMAKLTRPRSREDREQ